MKRRRMNGYLLAGGILAGFLAVVILLGIFWTPYDPAAMSVGPKLDGPSLLHPMGTDNFGRDILSRVMQGAGTTWHHCLGHRGHRRGGGHPDRRPDGILRRPGG